MTEDQYKQIVGDRLAKDDFIEDDDGGGYQDNGMDDWDEENYSDSEEENTKRKGESQDSLLASRHLLGMRRRPSIEDSQGSS